MAPDTYEEFTDRQRTRVVKRDALDEQAATHTSIGNTQALSQTKEGLFDGLSIAQIIAGAAAAATSMVLASKIGIAGSVIGAAVSSVITVVSSQLYRHFLDASAEKLKNSKDVLPTPSLGSKPHRAGTPTSFATTTRVLGADDELTTRVMGAADDATRLMGNAGAGTTTTAAAQSGTRIAPERLQVRAEAERAATQRKVIGFSVLAAIVALVATVGIILALTAGEGLGEKTAPIFAPATAEDTPAVTDTDANANNAPSDDAEQHGTTQDGDSSAADQGNTNVSDNSSSGQDTNDASSNTSGTHGTTGNNASSGQTGTGSNGGSNTGGATDGASGTGTDTGADSGAGAGSDTSTGSDADSTTGTDGANSSDATAGAGTSSAQSSAGAGVASTSAANTAR